MHRQNVGVIPYNRPFPNHTIAGALCQISWIRLEPPNIDEMTIKLGFTFTI